MGQVYDGISGRLRQLIEAQPIFFVATAPLSAGGHVNVSPKGMRGTFTVVDEHRVRYLDYHGSGAETAAHLRENGRITVMFCTFDGPAQIIRLHGKGSAVPCDDPAFAGLVAVFGPAVDRHGVRSVIDVKVERVSDSCGFAVPVMTYDGDRDLLVQWLGRRDDAALARYRADKNRHSIDGLPAFTDPGQAPV
ncbi:MAG TPA: pyridoxamine 5'-phosphate oxidase family protein [Dermatophilaceae bacterium]|nr:pyridoxamine 5'-phosphate oxidase family protein [Dermatophilaceae bacterium]